MGNLTGNIFQQFVRLVTGNAEVSRTNPLQVQPLSASRRPISDDPHSIIHSGRMYSFDTTTADNTVTIADNGTLDVVVKASGTNYPHIEFKYKLGGKGRLLMYELASDAMATGGTEIENGNKKWHSESTFQGQVLNRPTVDLTGAKFKEGCIILGTALGSQRSGSGDAFDDEVIIAPGKPCLIRLVNQSGGVVDGCLCVRAYNSPIIADS